MALRILGDSSGASYLGIARQKLAALEKTRLRSGQRELHKTFYIGETRILLRSADYGTLIEIDTLLHGKFFIVFVTGASLFGLDWRRLSPLADGTYKAYEKRLLETDSLVVHRYAPDKHISLPREIGTVENKYKKIEELEIGIEHSVGLYHERVLIYKNGFGIFITDGENTSQYVYGASALNISRESGEVAVSGREESSWNGCDSLLTTLVPIYGEPEPVRKWVPKVFAGLPASGYGIGEFVYGTEEEYGEYVEVVYAGGFTDLTQTENPLNHGVAEILWKLGKETDDPIRKMYCYTGLRNDNAPRDSFSDRTGFTGNFSQKYYNDLSGRLLGPTCIYDISQLGDEPTLIKHYGYFMGNDTIVSIVVSESSGKGYLYINGSHAETFEGYRWHSTSIDGNVLALCSVSALIVADFGVGKPFDGSTREGLEPVIRKLKSETAALSLDGVVVPYYQEEDVAAPVNVHGRATKTIPGRDVTFDAAMGGIEHLYPIGIAAGASGWKLTIEQIGDTFVAKGRRWEDECFDSASYTLLTRNADSSKYSVTVDGQPFEADSFDALAQKLPYFLALFTDVDPHEIVLAEWSSSGVPRSITASSGVGVFASTIQRAGILILGPLIEGYGCGENAYEITPNGKAPFRWSLSDGTLHGCSGEEIESESNDSIVDVRAEATCKGYVTLQVEDSCGYTYSRDIPAEPSPLGISGPTVAAVGEFYSAGGGIGPYSLSFSAGSIDEESGELLSISACSAPGERRTGFVRVTDSCGEQAEKEVVLPGGVWVLVEDNVRLETYSAASPSCWCIETLVNGASMEKITWAPYCSTITCAMYGFEAGDSDCDSDTVYVGGLPDECGNAPLSGYSGSGDWECFVAPGYSGDCGLVRYYPTPAYSVILGYRGYGRYSKDVFEWQCP